MLWFLNLAKQYLNRNDLNEINDMTHLQTLCYAENAINSQAILYVFMRRDILCDVIGPVTQPDSCTQLRRSEESEQHNHQQTRHISSRFDKNPQHMKAHL